MGTNTDPYQRAEGRYRLMPGIIGALADSGTPFSKLTKGTMCAGNWHCSRSRRSSVTSGSISSRCCRRAAGGAGAGDAEP